MNQLFKNFNIFCCGKSILRNISEKLNFFHNFFSFSENYLKTSNFQLLSSLFINPMKSAMNAIISFRNLKQIGGDP